MSKLLDQAIVEAEALREAAFKSAEAAVIDKYSGQIKEAVEQLLEAEFDLGLDDPDEIVTDGEGKEVLDQVPTSSEEEPSLGKEEGVKLCICPDTPEGLSDEEVTDVEEAEEQAVEPEEDVVVLNLSKLEEAIEGLSEDELYEEIAAELDEVLIEDDSETEGGEEPEEKIEESLTVDIEPVKDGWAGTPSAIMKYKGEQLLAMLQDDEHREGFEEINKAVKKLQNENKDLKKTLENKNKEFKNKETHVQKLTEAVTMMKEILEESNVVNAKLLYKVKVLESNSLNERQKSHLAEKLSEAKSVEEAKLIFETLQSSVGSTKRHPESLSEAVARPSSTLLVARKSQSAQSGQEPALDRWKTLAGIK